MNTLCDYIKRCRSTEKHVRGITSLTDDEREALFKSRKAIKMATFCSRTLILVREWLRTYEQTKITSYLIDIIWQKVIKLKHLKNMLVDFQEYIMLVPFEDEDEQEAIVLNVDRIYKHLVKFQRTHLLDCLKITPLYEYVKMYGSSTINDFYEKLPKSKDSQEYENNVDIAFTGFRQKVEDDVKDKTYQKRFKSYTAGIESRFKALNKMDNEKKEKEIEFRKKEANDALDRFISIFSSAYNDCRNERIVGLSINRVKHKGAATGKIIMISKYYNGKCTCWYFKDNDDLTRFTSKAMVFNNEDKLEKVLLKLNKNDGMAAAAVMI